jgi:hypothetical protein
LIDETGDGFSLTIPTLLIPLKEGDMLIKYIKENNEKVVLQAIIDLSAKAGKKVEYSVWYGTMLDLTLN